MLQVGGCCYLFIWSMYGGWDDMIYYQCCDQEMCWVQVWSVTHMCQHPSSASSSDLLSSAGQEMQVVTGWYEWSEQRERESAGLVSICLMMSGLSWQDARLRFQPMRHAATIISTLLINKNSNIPQIFSTGSSRWFWDWKILLSTALPQLALACRYLEMISYCSQQQLYKYQTNNSGIIDRNVFVSAHFIICWLIVVDKWQTLHHTSLIMMGNLRVWSPGFPVSASQYCGTKSNFPLIIVWVRSVSMTLCQ